MPGRFGIVGSGLSRQRRLAMIADRGYDGDHLMQALGRQAPAQGRRMAVLGAGFLPVGVLTTGVGACGGLAEGGSDEFEAFLPSRASS